MADLKLGIDVGGTFTDIVLQFDDGRLVQAKAPSTPGREADGVINAIEAIAEAVGRNAESVLAETRVINFGTTVATNAMLQGKGVPVGMLTSSGFRDIVELRRGWKEVMFDLKLPPPRAIVPRRYRLGVAERIGADGTIVEPLDEAAVRARVGQLRAAGINSIAICFLFSFVNDAHERRAAEIVREEHPEADVYLSSAVLPRIREYERFSTTIVNAYLSPLLKTYLRRLSEELRLRGFTGQLFVMQSNGGTVAPETAGETGCAALLSGPAAGVVAAARIGEVCGAESIIGVDMGGTSYDVSLIRDGTPETRSGDWFNRNFVGLPMLGIHTVGAGGGSIAWIDAGGALRVGPQSAGAQPGPACYGRGGREATVTDAFLCLGYLNPDFFLGGRMRLDPALAREAVERSVGAKLGMSVEEAAFGILRIVNNNMSNAIRYVSVARGLDPRDFTLMSFGGAGSITVGTQARDLGITRILVPRSASVFCALGELWADLRVSQILPLRQLAGKVDLDALSDRLDAMAAPHVEAFRTLPGVESVRTERSAELHYLGQSHEIATPIAQAGEKISDEDWQSVQSLFHVKHKENYAFELLDKPIEVLSVAQDIVGQRPWAIRSEAADGKAAAADPRKETRRVCFEVGGQEQWFETPVYDGTRIQPGFSFVGPAVIEEVDTTIVVQPGDRVVLNAYQVFEIEVVGD